MSADNWTQCPRCLKRRALEIENKRAEVETAYGKVSVARFDQMRAELESLKTDRVDDNFREDYEIGVFNDGEFFVQYTGACGTCNLRHEFKYEQTVNVDGDA